MVNSSKREQYRAFLKSSMSRYQNAGEVIKQAADEEALNGIKDPNSRGTTSIPGFGDGSNHAALNMPTSRSNMEAPNKDRNIINVSNPDGTGQGEYIQPRDGDALDAAAKSPTTPLEKMSGIAAQLKASADAIANAFNKSAAPEAPVQEQPEQPAQPAQPAQPVQEKQASPAQTGFTNADLENTLDDPDTMSKLAALSLVMLGSEDGRRMVADTLEKEAGIREAQSIIGQVTEDLYKEAAAVRDYNEAVAMQAYNDSLIAAERNNAGAAMQNAMSKQASAQPQAPAGSGFSYGDFLKAAMAGQAHNQWETYFNDSPMQKQAYQQGAADGDAAAAAMAEGGEPEIPGSGEVTPDDVIAYLQQLVESGQVQPEEAEAVLQALGSAGDDGVDPAEFADAIRQAVESGQIQPEEAEAIAQQYLAQFGGGDAAAAPADAEVPAGAEEEAAAAAAQDPVAAGAAAEGVQKAASVINYLWNQQ